MNWGGAQFIPTTFTFSLLFRISRHSLKLSPEAICFPSTQLKQIKEGIWTFSSSRSSAQACKHISKWPLLQWKDHRKVATYIDPQVCARQNVYDNEFKRQGIYLNYIGVTMANVSEGRNLRFEFVWNSFKSKHVWPSPKKNLQSSSMKILELIQSHRWSIIATAHMQISTINYTSKQGWHWIKRNCRKARTPTTKCVEVNIVWFTTVIPVLWTISKVSSITSNGCCHQCPIIRVVRNAMEISPELVSSFNGQFDTFLKQLLPLFNWHAFGQKPRYGCLQVATIIKEQNIPYSPKNCYKILRS